jgi:hypothetical protein
VNRALNRLSLFLLFFVQGVPSYAANPDLISAPAPVLSEAAWQELERHSSAPKTVTFHAQITAARGAVSTVAIREADRCPSSSSEVQSWIKHHWKFVAAFSGTVVQPISFKVVKGAVPTPTPTKTGEWGKAEWSLFQNAPKPLFPEQYSQELLRYVEQTHYMAGLLLETTVRQGAIVDIRILAQKGPNDLAEYTVRWVREHWVFKPNISGTYNFPVYYGFAR